MALNGLDVIYASGKDFIPHIEERAIRYTMRNYVMSARVKKVSDMTGWNVRKVSEYLRGRRAQTLAEDTDIPDTKLVRARKAEIEPIEVGDRYRISDRRVSTDLEDILSDTVEALGRAVGDRREADLFTAALAGFRGGAMGSTSTDYSVNLPIDGQFEFRKAARRGQLYHVVHPFQARTVMKDLIAYNGASAQAALEFRDSNIASWTVPAFEGLNIAVSDFLPRKIVNNVPVYGTGGTFRLALLSGDEIGVNVTAAITVSATPATTVANIKAALEALTFSGNGTWTVAGASNAAITVTPPTTLYLDGDSELRVAVDPANPTVVNQKSAYDLVTTLTSAPLDKDGAEMGVVVTEKSASAKALLFYRDALLLDIRSGLSVFFETVHQGRTGEYSVYETYGIGEWQGELGMTIETKANSAFATG